jgi:hypothetical protein
MMKPAIVAVMLATAGLALAPAAVAHSYVSVNVDGVWVKHKHRHVAQGDKVYTSGTYAKVWRRGGATYVHAYPGVRVFVGSAGGVSVSLGF